MGNKMMDVFQEPHENSEKEEESSKENELLLRKEELEIKHDLNLMMSTKGWKWYQKFAKKKASDLLALCVRANEEVMLRRAQGAVIFHNEIGIAIERYLELEELEEDENAN